MAALFYCLSFCPADELTGLAYAYPDVLTPELRQWLTAQSSPIRIGVTSIPPQVFRDTETDALSGLCIDFIHEIEQILAHRFEVVYYNTWNEMMGAAFARNIDVVYAAQKTPSREAAFLFTDPYLTFDNKIVTTEDVEGPLTLDGLADKTVAVVSGAAIEEYLQNHYPKIRLLGVDDELVGLMRVSFNQADAMVIEIARASWYIQQNKFTNLHIAGDAGYVYRLGFACRSDRPELTAILNAGLSQISPLRRTALINTWVFAAQRRAMDIRILFGTLAAAGLVLLAVFVWNRMLSLEVRRRTADLERELGAHQEDIDTLRRFETIISLSEDMMAFVDCDGIYRAVNDAYLKAVNKTREEVIGRGGDQVIGETLFDSFLRPRLQQAIRGDIVTNDRWVDLVTQGCRYVQASYHPYKNAAGIVEGVVIVVHDNTDTRIALQKLQDNQEQLRSLVAASPVGIGLVRDRVLLSVNRRICDITGYSEAELVGQNARMLYLTEEDYRYVGEEKYRQIELFGIGTVETRWRRKDGTVIDVLLSSVPLDAADREKGTTFTAMDITDRKRAEQSLEENRQAMYRLMGNLRGIAYRCRVTPDWPMEFISAGCEELCGYSAQEFYDDVVSWGRLIVEHDNQRIVKEVAAQLEKREPFQIEYRIRDRSGQIKWFWEKGCGVYGTDGQVAALEGFITDITDRKKAEENLQASESRYRELIDLAVDGILLGSNDGHIIEANSYILTISGRTREDLLGKHISTLFTSQTLEKTPLRFDLLKKGQIVVNERQLLRSDGTEITIEMRTKMMPDGTYQSIIHDITERKQAEQAREQLLKELRSKNEELESIVFIASHDLRSPLVNIRGFAGELEKSFEEIKAILSEAALSEQIHQRLKTPLNTDIPESLHYIKASNKKMDTLLNGLLRLSRIGSAQINPTTIAMDTLVGGIIGGLRFRIRENSIDIAVEGSLPACRGDFTLINQVFANLIDNAVKYRHPDRPCRIRIRGWRDGGRSVYQIEDNGIGIAPEHREKVFDIFHQLNPGAGGEGLGLTIVRRVLERQDGKIQINSEAGAGTTLTVILPVA
jgi:PAS domain S-box-containing protein